MMLVRIRDGVETWSETGETLKGLEKPSPPQAALPAIQGIRQDTSRHDLTVVTGSEESALVEQYQQAYYLINHNFVVDR